MSSLSWVKEKCETFAQRLVEAVQAYNNIFKKYNELKDFADLMKSENARLSKKLKEAEVALYVPEAEFKKVESMAEYCEDKSTNIELFNVFKVRAEMVKEYTEGTIFSWDPEATFSAWEKMKTLYLESDGEGDQQEVEPAGPSRSNPSIPRDGAFGSGATKEEVVVEDVVE